MKSRPVFCLLALFAVVSRAAAADALAPAIAAPIPTPLSFHAITLNFAGGSLQELIAQLNKIDGISVKLVTADTTDNATALPPLTFSSLRLNAVVDALRVLLRARGYLFEISTTEGPDSIVCVVQRTDLLMSSIRGSGPQFESFQVGGALKTHTIEEITGAIQAAWEFSNPAATAPLKFKYHAPTDLLFVEGSENTTRVVSKILIKLGSVFPQPMTGSVAPFSSTPTLPTADEQARLDKVASEVRRRRAVRENALPAATPVVPAVTEKK